VGLGAICDLARILYLVNTNRTGKRKGKSCFTKVKNQKRISRLKKLWRFAPGPIGQNMWEKITGKFGLSIFMGMMNRRFPTPFVLRAKKKWCPKWQNWPLPERKNTRHFKLHTHWGSAYAAKKGCIPPALSLKLRSVHGWTNRLLLTCQFLKRSFSLNYLQRCAFKMSGNSGARHGCTKDT